MDDAFDELQKMIDEDMRRIYSEVTINHAMNPRNVGSLKDADGWARYTGPCGDTMSMWIKMSGDILKEVRFSTDGCGTSAACGSMTTELAKGRKWSEALEISDVDVLRELGGLPEDDQHCALLAATTLKLAISDHLNRRREPWKKYYEWR